MVQAQNIETKEDTLVYPSNFDATLGLCLGFCTYFIECEFNLPHYLNSIKTSRGRGKVSGYNNLQFLQHMTKTGHSAYYQQQTDAPPVASYSMFSQYADIVPMILSIKYQFVKQTTVSGSFLQTAKFIQAHPNCYFFVSVIGESQSHALAAINTREAYGFFDSNAGMIRVQKRPRGTENGFFLAVSQYINAAYYGEFCRFTTISAYRPKDRSTLTCILK